MKQSIVIEKVPTAVRNEFVYELVQRVFALCLHNFFDTDLHKVAEFYSTNVHNVFESYFSMQSNWKLSSSLVVFYESFLCTSCILSIVYTFSTELP